MAPDDDIPPCVGERWRDALVDILFRAYEEEQEHQEATTDTKESP